MSSFYFCFILPILIRGYYLSPNELSNKAAEKYCELKCQSHLSSLHNIKDYTNAIHTIKHNPFIHSLTQAIWIGLVYDNTTDQVQWTDDSSLDFEPHIDLQSDEECAVLSPLSDYKLQSKPCDEQHIFLCNSCDHDVIIHKYVVISSEMMNYSQSNHKCNTEFGTTLASIHSDTDNNEAKLLCSLATNTDNKPCWIGLNDIEHEGEYEWMDGTTFDFGRNVSRGGYPWSNGYDINIDCVDINSFDFNDDDCNIIQPFLCNVPSNLCDRDQWYTINGEWTFDDYSCDLYNYYDDKRDRATLMNVLDTNWNHVVIDYMFKIFEVGTTGKSGITIGISNGFDRDYIFYVGFIVSDDDNIQLFISYDGLLLTSIDITDMYSMGQFHALKIALDQDQMIKVYTNDKLYIEYDMLLLNIPLEYVVNGIGIQNNGVSVHSKYLYISGSDTTETVIDTDHNINLWVTLQPVNTQISQTVVVGKDGSRSSRRLITFTLTNVVLLLAAVIGTVCIVFCALFCCVLYIKNVFSIKQNMDKMTVDKPVHVPQHSSVDITLETDNVLQRQETKDLELADIKEDNNRYLSPKMSELYGGNNVVESFDEYVTKGSQIINILQLPLPKTPNGMDSESMNEGYRGRKRNGYDIIGGGLCVSGVSDLFGSPFTKETDNDVFENMTQSGSENEKLKLEEEQTKLSVYF